MADPRRGGPEKCPRPCSECSGDHHFSDAMLDYASAEPEHEAAKAGVGFWFVCKHCDAWRECTDEDLDEEGEDEEEPGEAARAPESLPHAGEVLRAEELLGRVLADARARLGREPTADELRSWAASYRHVAIRLDAMARLLEPAPAPLPPRPLIADAQPLRLELALEHSPPDPDPTVVYRGFFTHVALATEWERNGTKGQTYVRLGHADLVVEYRRHVVVLRAEALTDAVVARIDAAEGGSDG